MIERSMAKTHRQIATLEPVTTEHVSRLHPFRRRWRSEDDLSIVTGEIDNKTREKKFEKVRMLNTNIESGKKVETRPALVACKS